MAAFFSCMLLFLHLNGTRVLDLFSKFGESLGPHSINVTEAHFRAASYGAGLPDVSDAQLLPDIINIRSESTTPIYVLIMHISAGWLAYVFGKFACKICIQGFSYAFPVILAVPLTVTLMITACGLRNEDSCYFKVRTVISIINNMFRKSI